MSDLAQIEIEHDVAEAAARRAAEEGVTVTAFISLLLRRSLERGPGEESVLVYDHVDDSGKFHIDREPDEDEESYRHRIVLYGDLFGCRGCYRKYSLKTLLISYLLSILMCCVVLDAAKAVLVCLHADELGSFPESREKELLRSYFTSQFGGRIKNIVQINNKF
jgi:hypothetical protein